MTAVMLTYDDGPVPADLDLLDLLAWYHVSATFFMRGDRALENLAAARLIADAGHAIGNHTHTHRDLRQLSPEEVTLEIDAASRAIGEATGVVPRLFRPPFGWSNSAVERVLRSRGLTLVLWDADGLDWQSKITANRVVENLWTNLRHGGVAVLHSGLPTTLAATEQIIKRCRGAGFTFKKPGDN
jgi:peptidoglycan/xylan/chitin deacetylase (PgdA/CDA1 family)